MPPRNAALLALFAILLVVCASARAQGQAGLNEDALIKGTTDFLAERARENALYIFETRLKEDKIVQCYLPTIYNDLKIVDLRLLLVGRQSFWKAALKPDIEDSVKRAVAGALHYHHRDLSKLNAILKLLKQQEDKRIVTIDYKSQTRSGPNLSGVLAALQATESSLEKIEIDGDCHIPMTPQAATLDDGIEKLKILQAWLEEIKSVRIDIDKVDLESVCAGGTVFPSKACDFIRGAKAAKKASDVTPADVFLDGTVATTIYSTISSLKTRSAVPKSEEIVRTVLNLGQLIAQYPDSNASDYQKITRYLLFFAELSEARSADQVKNVLTAYTLPPVSFGEKRRPVNHVLITAYVGWGQGQVRNKSDVGNQNRNGAYAPIGLEFSRGTRESGSWSIFVAPVDFGYPLTLKLNNIDKAATLADVVSPSLGFTYGIPKWPLSLGLAYQVGRKSDVGGEREKRALFFMAFDMPLLVLH